MYIVICRLQHYMLIDIYTNTTIDGINYDMTLDDIEDYLKNL